MEKPPIDLEKFARFAEALKQMGESSIVADAVQPQRPEVGSASLRLTETTYLAAINDTFIVTSPDQDVTDRGSIGQDHPDVPALVEHAELVTVAGRSRLRLRDESRGALLRQAAGNQTFLSLLERETDRDADEFDAVSADPIRLASAWLRSFLTGYHGDLARAPAGELRAAVAALKSLSGAPLPSGTPDLKQANRALILAEVLEPLRILIGHGDGWNNRPASDRFVGRSAELRMLREFVDELDSHGAIESMVRTGLRLIRGAGQAVGKGAAELFHIVAQGGLGKSALIAKFVLDHALGPGPTTFLFAYVDFDQASIDPREPQMLLREIVRQIAAQIDIPEIEELVSSLAREGKAQVSQSRDSFAELRRIIREHPEVGDRAFLLVLDTMEVVQYDRKAVQGVDQFLQQLISSKQFPKLRIVTAGRADLVDLSVLASVKQQRHELQPMSVTDAKDMATRLGRSIIGPDWRAEWSRRIAGSRDDRGDRREPLSIRVAVDIIVGERVESRNATSLDIAALGEQARGEFAARLYERRVRRHVRDEKARRLAWPGLIVRNVTPDIARGVLGRHCGLSPEQVDQAMALLAREIWMVEARIGPDGLVLKHRRELRARTLPLMRQHDRALFDRVNREARDYFASRRRDPRSAAEWLYHRLLEGEPPEEVNDDWQPEFGTALGDAVDDFAPGDPAHAYLTARTASAPLGRSAVANLPDRWAFEYLARAGSSLGSLRDATLVPGVLDLFERERPPGISAEAEAARGTLLIKAGRWSDPLVGKANDSWAEHFALAKSFRKARSRRSRPDKVNEASLTGTNDYRTLIEELACTRRYKDPIATALDHRLQILLDDLQVPAGKLDAVSLRTGAIFGLESCRSAGRLWASAQVQAQQSKLPLTISLHELRTLRPWLGTLAALLDSDDRQLLDDIFQDAETFQQPGRLEAPRLSAMLSRLISRLMLEQPADVDVLIRSYLARRQPDWVTPLGYAAARALASLPDAKLLPLHQRVHGYGARQGWIARLMGATGVITTLLKPRDIVGLFHRADEASDLVGMITAVTDICPAAPEADDFNNLRDDFESWMAVIDHVVQTGQSGAELVEQAPRPMPVTNASDPQKGRWGGSNERDGRALNGVIRTLDKSGFEVDLLVTSTDGSALAPPVIFHLHPSFPRSVITIRRIKDGRLAGLYGVSAYGAFTVGVQVRNGQGRWTTLEYDLIGLPGLPPELHDDGVR